MRAAQVQQGFIRNILNRRGDEDGCDLHTPLDQC